MDIPWVLVSILTVASLLVIFLAVFIKRKGWNRKTDYRDYYYIGITWLPLGIAFWLIFDNIVGIFFIVMGLSYLSIGLKNKERWGKPQKVSPQFQKTLMLLVLIGILVFIIGILFFEKMIAS